MNHYSEFCKYNKNRDILYLCTFRLKIRNEVELEIDTNMALWEYFIENKFTDMVLITRDQKINAHSAILTHFCPFLSGLIKNHFLNYEDVILSIPDTYGTEMSESLYALYSGENCERFSILLGSEQSSTNNYFETETNLEKGFDKFLEGVPVKVLLKNESDIEDDLDGSSYGTSDVNYQLQDGSVGIGVQEQVNYIGHDLDYTSPLPENNDLLNSNSSLKPKISTSRVKVDFECDQCANIFSSKALLTKHSHQVHWRNYGYSTFPDKLVICSANKETCLEAFLSKELLDKHRKTVHVEGQKGKSSNQKYQCEECGKHISSPECLRLHVDAIHRGIKHPCPHCNYSTGWPKNLDEHIMFYHTHANDESILKYQCSICGKKFKRQNSLAEHELTHNPKTLKCSHCKRGFSHDRYLERHISSVHGDKKFPCETCGKKFTTQEYVKTHFNSVHLDHSERRHKCEICGQGFNKKMAFKSHMNKHQGLKPFICPAPECDKCFSDDTAWSHHKRNCSFMRLTKANHPN